MLNQYFYYGFLGVDDSIPKKLVAVRRRLFSEDELNGLKEEDDEPVTISWETDSGSGFSDM